MDFLGQESDVSVMMMGSLVSFFSILSISRLKQNFFKITVTVEGSIPSPRPTVITY